jgi:hypothetical protein
MTVSSVDFDAEYSNILIDDAARAFVDRLFRKYLWLLVAVCVINIVGFVAVLVLSGSANWMIGALSLLGPLYFPWRYYRLPGELSTRLKEVLVPNARVSVAPSGFTLAAKGRSATLQWADLKAIVEYPEYFLFVFGLLAFTFIPKRDMPLDAQQLIRDVAARSVQS